MLRDLDAEIDREVDVTITAEVDGRSVTIGVEATAASRAADLGWVDEMLGKHASLPTNLILVSQSGFTPQARKKAENRGAIPLEPKDMVEGDPAYTVVNRLKRVWGKTVYLTPRNFAVVVSLRNGQTAQPPITDYETPLFRGDGATYLAINREVESRFEKNFPVIAEGVGLRDIAETTDKKVHLTLDGWTLVGDDGDEQPICVQWTGGPDNGSDLYPVERIEVKADTRIEVNPIDLTHKKLSGSGPKIGKVAVSYGTEDTGGLLVVTEDESGSAATYRTKGGLEIALKHGDGLTVSDS